MGSVTEWLRGGCPAAAQRYDFFINGEVVAFGVSEGDRAFHDIGAAIFNGDLGIRHKISSQVSQGIVAIASQNCPTHGYYYIRLFLP
jgi:hypothetical protein